MANHEHQPSNNKNKNCIRIALKIILNIIKTASTDHFQALIDEWCLARIVFASQKQSSFSQNLKIQIDM